MAEHAGFRYDECAGLDLTGLDLADVLADDAAVESLRADGVVPEGDQALASVAALAGAVGSDLPTETYRLRRLPVEDTGLVRMAVRGLAAAVAALVLVSGTGMAAAGSGSFNPVRELFEWGRSIGERTVSPSADVDRSAPEPAAVAPRHVLEEVVPPAPLADAPEQVVAGPPPKKGTATEWSPRREAPVDTAAPAESAAPAEPETPAASSRSEEPQEPEDPEATPDAPPTAPPTERQAKANGDGTKKEKEKEEKEGATPKEQPAAKDASLAGEGTESDPEPQVEASSGAPETPEGPEAGEPDQLDLGVVPAPSGGRTPTSDGSR